MKTEREKFEKWISSPPFEKSVRRYRDDASKYAWPGQYRHLETQTAWEAWQEALKQREQS